MTDTVSDRLMRGAQVLRARADNLAHAYRSDMSIRDVGADALADFAEAVVEALAASPQGEGSSGDTTNMIAPVEAVAWRDKVGLGRPLYEAFWLRNGGNAPAWCDQASAIRFMWDAIADDAVQALAVTPPQPDAQGWRDIATAPRDGASILAICASAYSPVAGVTWWNGSWTHYSRPAEKWHGGVGKWFPTHWMPLPPPPSAHPAPIKPSADTGELREKIIAIIEDSVWADDATEFTEIIHGINDAADAILDLIHSEECETCYGSGRIFEAATTTGANQHSACQYDCEDCDGTGYNT